ncbi:response regulator transcription factor [Kitasatospora albolonga]|uniref:response regulator transcription factor n=1 Tax=Kitasatospora albolonga TaxID=68173 RepID=UPI0031E993A2
MTIRVVVADDQELVRSGFVMMLDVQPDIEVVGEAADGAEALALVRSLRPDVLVLDIRMPGTDGIEVARALAAEGSPCRVLVLTTFDADEYVYDALYAGAGGFLLKTVRRDDFVHAVRVVAAGEALLSPSVTRRLIADYTRRVPRAPLPRTAPSDGGARLGALTARERETLRCLAQGLSNAEIAALLVVTEHTVKTHVSRILTKLGLRDRAQAAILAYECGLVVPGTDT